MTVPYKQAFEQYFYRHVGGRKAWDTDHHVEMWETMRNVRHERDHRGNAMAVKRFRRDYGWILAIPSRRLTYDPQAV